MGTLIGIIGKPSSGKTTILNALTLVNAKMGEYPFTTIKANKGVGYIRVLCPCTKYGVQCSPNSGYCNNGVRYVPVELMDVAGLVPGAAEGKGMGNQFLDDLRQSDVLIHVIDASGSTDAEGNPVDFWDPGNDIQWIEEELTKWMEKILVEDWKRIARKLETEKQKIAKVISEKLAGLKVTEDLVVRATRDLAFISTKQPTQWDSDELYLLVTKIRETRFPMIVAANKIDRDKAKEVVAMLKSRFPNHTIIETSGLAELVLRMADKQGLIEYNPGSTKIIYKIDKNDRKVANVKLIEENMLNKGQTTGVVELLEAATFKTLKLIPVFPVVDASHLTDKDGKVLPDCHLVPEGTTAIQLASKIHTDLAKNFINAIHVNTGKRISANHVLQSGDIIKINSAAK